MFDSQLGGGGGLKIKKGTRILSCSISAAIDFALISTIRFVFSFSLLLIVLLFISHYGFSTIRFTAK